MIRINRSRPLPKLLALAVSGVAVFAPAGATASGPLVTDPAGDVSHLCATISLACPVEDATGLQPSSVDIVSADIQANGTSFDFTIDVVDLAATMDANEQHGFVMRTTDGHGISLVATRNSYSTGQASLWGGAFEGAYATAVPVTYDHVGDTVTFTVTTTQLSDATGTTFQAGSTLSGLEIWTGQSGNLAVAYVSGVPGTSDSATSTSTFTA